jgi:hypothetical protein
VYCSFICVFPFSVRSNRGNKNTKEITKLPTEFQKVVKDFQSSEAYRLLATV